MSDRTGTERSKHGALAVEFWGAVKCGDLSYPQPLLARNINQLIATQQGNIQGYRFQKGANRCFDAQVPNLHAQLQSLQVQEVSVQIEQTLTRDTVFGKWSPQ